MENDPYSILILNTKEGETPVMFLKSFSLHNNTNLVFILNISTNF